MATTSTGTARALSLAGSAFFVVHVGLAGCRRPQGERKPPEEARRPTFSLSIKELPPVDRGAVRPAFGEEATSDELQLFPTSDGGLVTYEPNWSARQLTPHKIDTQGFDASGRQRWRLLIERPIDEGMLDGMRAALVGDTLWVTALMPGDVVVAGEQLSSPADGDDVTLLRIDALSGRLLDHRRIRVRAGKLSVAAMTAAGDGGVLILAGADPTAESEWVVAGHEGHLLRLDRDGKVEWKVGISTLTPRRSYFRFVTDGERIVVAGDTARLIRVGDVTATDTRPIGWWRAVLDYDGHVQDVRFLEADNGPDLHLCADGPCYAAISFETPTGDPPVHRPTVPYEDDAGVLHFPELRPETTALYAETPAGVQKFVLRRSDCSAVAAVLGQRYWLLACEDRLVVRQLDGVEVTSVPFEASYLDFDVVEQSSNTVILLETVWGFNMHVREVRRVALTWSLTAPHTTQ
jgi:hypothetical protein